jgi:predicted transcriptional regulator of viral defense system/very-short-patch-repair endonuclease
MSEDRELHCPGDTEIRAPHAPHAPHADARIAALAGRQHGVVSRRQLLDAGVTATMIVDRTARGHLVALHRGVYAVGHAHLRTQGFWLAAILAVGDRAALSHRDAAALHELRPSNRVRIEVSTAKERASTAKLDVHGRRRLDARDVTTVEGIPVTTVARTLVDLAEVLAHQALTKVCGEAERQGKLDLKAIEESIGRVRGRRGNGIAGLRAALAELAAYGATLTRSHLEDQFLSLLDAHDLPRPATNAYVAGYEVDAVWHAHRVAVELDGWGAHKTRRAFQHDRTKGNAIQAARYTLLCFTHPDVVRRPHDVAAEIAAQLSRADESARRPRAGGRRAS